MQGHLDKGMLEGRGGHEEVSNNTLLKIHSEMIHFGKYTLEKYTLWEYTLWEYNLAG